MSKYTDLRAYRLALKLRTPKTILVEGVTDKAVISRFLLERNYSEGNYSQYMIDEVSIVSDEEKLSRVGSRDKVLLIAQEFAAEKDKLICLVDREWDGVNFESIENSSFDQSMDCALLTRGHSIENYWFNSSALISFLMQNNSSDLSLQYLEGLKERFEEILYFAASFSLAAKDASVINRCSDLITASDVEWVGGSFIAKDAFSVKLGLRGVSVDMLSLMSEKALYVRSLPKGLLQWICHGHLGEEAIRACSASIAVEYGVNATVVNSIERGNRQGKLQHDASYIASCDIGQLEPLGQILSWVRGESVSDSSC